MSEFVKNLMSQVKAKNPSEPEFHQAVYEVASSLVLALEKHPEYRKEKNIPENNVIQCKYYYRRN